MKFLNYDRVLCLSPHPDDVEYGMLGTIMKYKDTKFDLVVLSEGGDFDESTAHELYKDGYDPSRRGNARLWPLYNWRYDEMVFIHHPKNSRKTPDSYLPRFSSHMKDEQIGQEIFEYRVMDHQIPYKIPDVYLNQLRMPGWKIPGNRFFRSLKSRFGDKNLWQKSKQYWNPSNSIYRCKNSSFKRLLHN